MCPFDFEIYKDTHTVHTIFFFNIHRILLDISWDKSEEWLKCSQMLCGFSSSPAENWFIKFIVQLYHYTKKKKKKEKEDLPFLSPYQVQLEGNPWVDTMTWVCNGIKKRSNNIDHIVNAKTIIMIKSIDSTRLEIFHPTKPWNFWKLSVLHRYISHNSQLSLLWLCLWIITLHHKPLF